jgi:hypothetical protein
MSTINCTVTVAQPAYKGTGVRVILSGAESLSVLPVLSVGNSCSISSSSKTGLIDSIDTYGHSFLVVPTLPQNRFDSDTSGVLKVNDLITITY